MNKKLNLVREIINTGYVPTVYQIRDRNNKCSFCKECWCCCSGGKCKINESLLKWEINSPNWPIGRSKKEQLLYRVDPVRLMEIAKKLSIVTTTTA